MKKRFSVGANKCVASPWVSTRLRRKLLSRLGIPVGDAIIGDHVWFGGDRIRFGTGVYVNRGVGFDNSDWITIGSNVSIGHDVLVCTSTHELGPSGKRAGAAIGKPIVIGDGVWIGARATILPGVTIGSGCVIAAGSVVVNDCQPDSLYAGVPAARVRALAAETVAQVDGSEADR